MPATHDVIVIGGGHNGLVCAAYLAKAGRKVLLLEAAESLGGAARTGEIAPGFKVSSCAHILHLLHPKVVSELELARHGLVLAVSDMATVALATDGNHLTFAADSGLAAATLRAHSAADAANFPTLQARLHRFAAALQPFLAKTPPRLASGALSDRLTLLKLGWAIRRLGREEMREFLRVIAINVADLLEDELESPLLQGALAFDAVLGTHLGPRSPNSLLTLLYRMAGEIDGRRGALALPR
ncbi:MAG: phytoene desaturase family protein, partial [Kiloniellales bacterium]